MYCLVLRCVVALLACINILGGVFPTKIYMLKSPLITPIVLPDVAICAAFPQQIPYYGYLTITEYGYLFSMKIPAFFIRVYAISREAIIWPLFLHMFLLGVIIWIMLFITYQVHNALALLPLLTFPLHSQRVSHGSLSQTLHALSIPSCPTNGSLVCVIAMATLRNTLFNSLTHLK
jgi:hypothetical protein